MTVIRSLFALTTASATAFAAWATPVAAQAEAGAGPVPEMNYEYAVAPQSGPVTYQTNPVVQPLPGAPEERHEAPPMDPHGEAHERGYPGGPPDMAYDVPPAPAYAPAPQGFDRAAWIGDCHRRIDGISRADDRATVIGGLLGAIAGGVIGNRVADGHRTAGTLVGAGVGGLAGAAVGSAIDQSGRRRADECAIALDRYMDGGYPGHDRGEFAHYHGGHHAPAWGPLPAPGPGLPAYGYGYGQGYYGYGYGYAYVPVLVAIPQQRFVRETVTEQWVDVPVRTRSVTRSRVIRQRAPADKRIRYTKK